VPTVTDCVAPTVLTVDEAHAAMQQHVRCPTATCPARPAALAVLCDAGHLVPAAATPDRRVALVS
jgi:hypothetical protein